MKFNFLKKPNTILKNYEGAPSYQLSPEMELYSATVTSLLHDSFYEKAEERLIRLQQLIEKVSPEYCAKLAVYARRSMNLRSVPIVLSVELAKKADAGAWVGKAIEQIVLRPDEITETLAYYQQTNKRTGTKRLNRLSKQIQKGLAKAFNRFDEYQFAKYNQNTEVKLRDALFLVHPKPKDLAQQVVFDKITQNTLSTAYTWETELSALGQLHFGSEKAKNKAFRAKWEELILSKKVGYMALLRNLRNMLESNISDECLDMVLSYLSEENAVRTAKQLPFRYWSAYRELSNITDGRVTRVIDALEKAMLLSAQNIKGFDNDTKVVLACDVSGSMQQKLSAKSSLMYYDIGLLLAMLLQNRCKNVVMGMFGDTWKVIQMPSKSILSNVAAFHQREGEVGYSTNAHLVIEDLLKREYQADKVMIFTDTQLWNSQNRDANSIKTAWQNYKRKFPKAKLYLFDLAGYGQSPMRVESGDVYLLAGWSDKIFEVLDALENGQGIVDFIQGIDL
ncbi:TROVE domain-containing protein [Flectobacillus roseus]|uniref:TROVE domain-containing protein n=1 Tax=Flectobacillus roseus TaxID=502259 RepID=A0ABT6Y4N1_9BACT|nr:TROVE domain-containing protein [Flectobacillus roseus]MDI9858529.1 TROVE domain-containing protein [Flectobacillus roseus]